MATQYRVYLECREPGALGEFSPRHFEIMARNGFNATAQAVDAAHDLGLETRFPLRVVTRANFSEGN